MKTLKQPCTTGDNTTDIIVNEYRRRKNKTLKQNPHNYPFFCFPCGQYHGDLEKHEAKKSHKRNMKRWRTEMGYRKKWSRES